MRKLFNHLSEVEKCLNIIGATTYEQLLYSRLATAYLIHINVLCEFYSFWAFLNMYVFASRRLSCSVCARHLERLLFYTSWIYLVGPVSASEASIPQSALTAVRFIYLSTIYYAFKHSVKWKRTYGKMSISFTYVLH